MFRDTCLPLVMALLRCPICDKPFESSESTAVPFCSPRCRQIDLGRWLDERYSFPYARPNRDEDADDEAEA